MKARVKRNQNVIAFIVGPTGSGKSYSSLRLGETLDKDFNIDNICFSFKEVLDLLENKKVKPGSVVVLEEVGINADARNFYKEDNKNMAYVLESFRTDRLIFIMNVPDQMFADKKARKLAHVIIEMSHVDFVHKQGIGRVKWIQNNPIHGRTYYKPTRGIVNNNYSLIGNTRFPKPSKSLCTKYEKKRGEFLKQVKQNASKAIEESRKEKPVNKQPMDIINELKEEFGSIIKVKDYLSTNKGKLTIRHISGMLSIGPQKASVIKDYLDDACT